MSEEVVKLEEKHEKEMYKEIYKKLEKAIKNGEIKQEIKLLWTAVAILENDNMDWKAAEDAHPEITKLSQLYTLVEDNGRARGLLRQKKDVVSA